MSLEENINLIGPMSRCDKTELCKIWFCYFCENSRTFSKVVTLIYAANQQSIEFPIWPYSQNHLLSLLSMMTTHYDWKEINFIASNNFIWFLGNGEPRNHQTTDSWFSTKIYDKVLLLRTRYSLTEGYWKLFLISVWKLSQMTSFQFSGRCQACCCG